MGDKDNGEATEIYIQRIYIGLLQEWKTVPLIDDSTRRPTVEDIVDAAKAADLE